MKTNIYLIVCVWQISIVSGQQKTTIPCNDKEIVMNYSKAINPEKFHEYTVGPTKICNTKESPIWCSKDFVYKTLLTDASMAAPGAESIPIKNCGIYDITTSLGLVSGQIRMVKNEANHLIQNFTKPNHTLHPGKVEHKVFQVGEDIFISSHGVGYGDYSVLNEKLADWVWEPLHEKLKETVASKLDLSYMPEPPKIKLTITPSKQETKKKKVCETSFFDWILFEDLTPKMKDELKKLDLYEMLAFGAENGCTMVVAPTDLDKNKKPGYAYGVLYGGTACCGTLGCSFAVTEEDGKDLFYLETSVCKVKPTQGGILTSAGRFVKLDFSKVKPEEEKKEDTGDLLGGKNPEELGKILLKALQTNDLKTWTRCIHPEQSRDRDLIIRRFGDVRNKLYQEGVTDWSAIRFSRVTFQDKSHDGIKVASGFKIEFTYKKGEFFGSIWFWSASTVTNGNTYYIWAQPDLDLARLHRNTNWRE